MGKYRVIIGDTIMKQIIRFLMVGCLVFLMGGLTISLQGAYAQEIVTNTSFPVEITLKTQSPDAQGTDVTNIYVIKINFADETFRTSEQYTIVYFLDGRRILEYTQKALPFSFMRNLRGQRAGVHEIKIEIEDNDENVIARKMMPVTVVH